MRLFIRGIARNLDHQRNALGTVKVPSARTYRAAQIVNMWWVWEPSRYEGGGGWLSDYNTECLVVDHVLGNLFGQWNEKRCFCRLKRRVGAL